MEESSQEQVYEPAVVYKLVQLLAGSSHSGKEVLGLFKSVPSVLTFDLQNKNPFKLGKVIYPCSWHQQFKLWSKILVGDFWEVLKSGGRWTYAMNWGWLFSEQ